MRAATAIAALWTLGTVTPGCVGGQGPQEELEAPQIAPDEHVVLDTAVGFDGAATTTLVWRLPPEQAYARVELFAGPALASASVQGRMPAGLSQGMMGDWHGAACQTAAWSGIQACTMAPVPGGDYALTVSWLQDPSAWGTTQVRVRVLASVEPLVMRADWGSVHYGPFPGALYVRRQGEPWDQGWEGISAKDVMQGKAADCYFLSGAASVAQVRPDLMLQALANPGDGTYWVRFYRPGVEPPELVEVHVTDRLPLRDDTGLPAYVRSPTPAGADPWELWPMIVEKAYAKYRGSYEAIGNGGTMTDALALTGYRVSYFPVATSRPEDILFAIQDVASQHGFILASTYPKDSGPGSDVPDAEHLALGIVPWHVYTVFGARILEDGSANVLLRNPWGVFEPGDAQGNGIFEYPFESFLRQFNYVTLGLPRDVAK